MTTFTPWAAQLILNADVPLTRSWTTLTFGLVDFDPMAAYDGIGFTNPTTEYGSVKWVRVESTLIVKDFDPPSNFLWGGICGEIIKDGVFEYLLQGRGNYWAANETPGAVDSYVDKGALYITTGYQRVTAGTKFKVRARTNIPDGSNAIISKDSWFTLTYQSGFENSIPETEPIAPPKRPQLWTP